MGRHLVLLSILLAACADVVIEPSDGGSAGTSSDGAGPIAGGAPATGGSEPLGGFGGDNGFGGIGEGGASMVGCPTIPEEDLYFVEHTQDGTVQLFNEGCDEALPTAQRLTGGECGPGTFIRACHSLGAPETQVELSGMTSLVDPGEGELTGTISQNTFSDVVITFDDVGEVGQAVRGSYEGIITSPDGDMTNVSAVFSLCRVPDLPPCP